MPLLHRFRVLAKAYDRVVMVPVMAWDIAKARFQFMQRFAGSSLLMVQYMSGLGGH